MLSFGWYILFHGHEPKSSKLEIRHVSQEKKRTQGSHCLEFFTDKLRSFFVRAHLDKILHYQGTLPVIATAVSLRK